MITTTIKNVKLFENEDSANVQVVTTSKFEGFIIKDGQPIKQEVDYFSISRSALTAQLCELSIDIACYRACQERSFNQKQLALILFGAKLCIEREYKGAGEVYQSFDGTEHSFERDCYITKIIKVELSDRSIRLLDNATVLP